MLALKSLIYALGEAYTLLIFVYVLMSWFPSMPGVIADVNRFLAKICDPYLNLFKRIIPPIGGMIDISPILALFVLQLATRLVVGLL